MIGMTHGPSWIFRDHVRSDAAREQTTVALRSQQLTGRRLAHARKPNRIAAQPLITDPMQPSLEMHLPLMAMRPV